MGTALVSKCNYQTEFLMIELLKSLMAYRLCHIHRLFSLNRGRVRAEFSKHSFLLWSTSSEIYLGFNSKYSSASSKWKKWVIRHHAGALPLAPDVPQKVILCRRQSVSKKLFRIWILQLNAKIPGMGKFRATTSLFEKISTSYLRESIFNIVQQQWSRDY